MFYLKLLNILQKIGLVKGTNRREVKPCLSTIRMNQLTQNAHNDRQLFPSGVQSDTDKSCPVSFIKIKQFTNTVLLLAVHDLKY